MEILVVTSENVTSENSIKEQKEKNTKWNKRINQQ